MLYLDTLQSGVPPYGQLSGDEVAKERITEECLAEQGAARLAARADPGLRPGQDDGA